MKIGKLKRGQQYIVACHTKVSGLKVGLGSTKTWYPGQMVTYTGRATRDPNKAVIYRKGQEDDFPWEYSYSWGSSDMYFEALPVTIHVQGHSPTKVKKAYTTPRVVKSSEVSRDV